MSRWGIFKAEVKPGFLQNGREQRDVYVLPPHKCTNRFHYWLFLTDVYGQVNSNAKWQHRSDDCLQEPRLLQLAIISQLFFVVKSNLLVLLVAKIVNEILATGETALVKNCISDSNVCFALGTVAQGPGNRWLLGMNITQEGDFSCSRDDDDKLLSLENIF